MSAVPVITTAQVQSWRKKMIKEVISNVLWSSLSNRVSVTSQIPNAKREKPPADVIHWVSDSFQKGVHKTTIPFLQKLQDMGQGGWQKSEGEEETPLMRSKSIHYNIQRKSLAVKDESVEGDLTEYYNIASQKVDLLTDYFSELTDYNFQRAFMRGADEFLTDDDYWNGQTFTSAPVTESYHPNFLVNGASAAVTWNATDATYGGSIQTALNALRATNTFSLNELDSMIFQADYSNGQKLHKLGWKAGNNSVQYVNIISEAQSKELTTLTGSGTWRELMTNAGARGIDNRAISGVIGIYKRTLVIVDERAPLWDTNSGTALADRIQYYKITDGRTPVAKTADDSGTCEMAKMCGKGAIGAAMTKDLYFVTKKFDYDFSEGMAAAQACGCERMDLVNTAITAKPLNQGSFIYTTSTPSQVI